jgi:ABC-type thiamine transport system ATPase subunit
MSITGPGRDVAIQGKLNPGKRSAEDGDPSSRPFTMIRQCDNMFEGLEDYKNDMGGNDTQKDESQDTQSFDTFLDAPDSGL